MPFYEKQVGGAEILLDVELHIGEGVTVPLGVTYSEPRPDSLPLSPFLTSAVLDTRSQATVTWTAPSNTGRPPITKWRVYRSINGGEVNLVHETANATPRSWTEVGLPTTSPEYVFRYSVRAVNLDGVGAESNAIIKQWSGTPPIQPPTAPTNLTTSQLNSTSVRLNWVETFDATVTKHGIFVGSVLTVDNLSPNALSYLWSGLVPGRPYQTVTVRRFNAEGWSPGSNSVTFTPPVNPVLSTMLMGCSDSIHDHGGTEVWDGWRVYRPSAMRTRADKTGNQRPRFLAYSKDGPNLGENGGRTPNYTNVFNEVVSDLNDFYYTGGSVSQTRSARWGISLYWSNGNENQDKGALYPDQRTGPVSDEQVAYYITSQRALYNGVHYVDPATGQRRFPDAYAGSNPTHDAEGKGIVAQWLHPSARYHDFVMWSMYPPGRQATTGDPTFNWPVFPSNPSSVPPAAAPTSFMWRCFYRTFQAQAQARIDRGDPTFKLEITCGEIGIGDDPGDSTTRPYYAVHGLAGGAEKMAGIYGLTIPFACWWDNQKVGDEPQNILSDEPTNTNPSTRVAWQNWKTYNHTLGGTHPGSWAGNPKPGWKTTGVVV